MVKSILDIEVNDTQFKSYVEAFNKYRAQAKEMPEAWADVNDSVIAIGAGFVAMSLEMERQYEATQRLAKAEADLAKAEKEALDEKKRAAKELSDREKESSDRRRRAVEETKQIAKNMADTAVSLGKWALIGEGAALVGGALGFWGLDRLVASIGQERRLAQGFGVTTGQRQALSVNAQRYFDVNSTLENVAESQADPSRRWVFGAMGVNPQGKDPAQLMADMALAARRIFMEGQGNEQWAQAHGLLSIFSMDDLRRMAATPEAQLRGSFGQAARDSAPGGRFFLADEVSRKWQNFIVGLDGATLALKDKLVDKLSALEPSLEKIMAKFTDLAIQVLDRIDFDALGKGLDTFTRYISSPQFQKDFKVVIDDIGYAANKLLGAMKLLGLLPDAAGGSVVYPDAANAADDAHKWDRLGRIGASWFVGPGALIAGDAGIGSYAGTYTGVAGQKGFAKAGTVAGALSRDLNIGTPAAAGILGNLLGEDPNLVAMNEKHPRAGRGGFGWAQWTGPRRREFESWSAANHLDPSSDQANYGFLVHELKTKFKSLLHKIQHESAADAAADVYRVFEAPARGDTTLGKRQRNAARVEVIVNNQTGGSVAATVNAASR